MDEEEVKKLIDFQDKALRVIFNELMMMNRYFTIEVNLRLPSNRELTYGHLQPYLEKIERISEIISKRPLEERESYFIVNANLFCQFVKHESFELAGRMYQDLVYFQHHFLQDEGCNLKKARIHHETLEKVIEEKSVELALA